MVMKVNVMIMMILKIWFKDIIDLLINNNTIEALENVQKRNEQNKMK